jgi:hypothetical protein
MTDDQAKAHENGEHQRQGRSFWRPSIANHSPFCWLTASSLGATASNTYKSTFLRLQLLMKPQAQAVVQAPFFTLWGRDGRGQ